MNKLIKTLCLASGLAAASLATGTAYAANDNIVSATDVHEILNVAKGFGFAELEKDGTGDPAISGMISGTKYVVYFYGCKHHKRCNDIQIESSWGGTHVTAAQIAHWNRTKRFGKAYLDKDGDPRLQMNVNLHYGVTEKNLQDTFDWWRVTLKMFKADVIHS